MCNKHIATNAPKQHFNNRSPKVGGGKEIEMPRGDRTGPAGMGPMTGRGMGYCAGYRTPGFANPAGRGFGLGMARGRGGGGGRGMAMRRGGGGFGFMPPFVGAPPMAMQDEETVLKSQVSALEQQLASIKARLSEIEQDDTADK